MTPYKAKIFFEDECRRIGTGWRIVTVKQGRKWLRLTDAMGRSERLPIAMLEKLKPQPVTPQ